MTLDVDAVVAVADLVGRTGATQFEVGYLRDPDDPDYERRGPGWYASARYRGARLMTDELATPTDAADALAGKLLDGADCVGCGRKTQAAAAVGEYASVRAGECVWRRDGAQWLAGCGARPSTGNRAQRRRRRR